MDRILRQWIVALAAAAGATLALAQALPSAPATPMNPDEALRQYDAAKTACNTLPKADQSKCLREAMNDYNRARKASVDSPDFSVGVGGTGSGNAGGMGSKATR